MLARHCNVASSGIPVLIEDGIGDNCSVLLEKIWLICSKLIDRTLLLPPLPPLLPYSILIVQVLKEPN